MIFFTKKEDKTISCWDRVIGQVIDTNFLSFYCVLDPRVKNPQSWVLFQCNAVLRDGTFISKLENYYRNFRWFLLLELIGKMNKKMVSCFNAMQLWKMTPSFPSLRIFLVSHSMSQSSGHCQKLLIVTVSKTLWHTLWHQIYRHETLEGVSEENVSLARPLLLI